MAEVLDSSEKSYANLINTDSELTVSQKENYKTVKAANEAYYAFLQSIDGTTGAVEQMTNAVEDNTDTLLSEISAIVDSFKELSLESKLSSIQSAYETLIGAIKEYRSQSFLSMETVDALMALDDEYINALIDENGQLQWNAETFQKLAEVKLDEAKASVYQEAMTKMAEAANMSAQMAANELARANGVLSQSAYEAAKAMYEQYQASALLGGDNKKVIDNIWNTAQRKVSMLDAQLQDVTDGTYNFAKASKNAAEEMTKVLDAELKVLDSQMEAGMIDFQKYMKKRTNLIEKYYRTGKIKAADYYNYLHDNYEKEISYMDKAISAVNDILDDKINSLEDEKKQIEDTYNLRIKKLEETKDAIEEANTARKNALELEKAAYELERAKSQRVNKVLTGDKGFIYTPDESAIKDAKDELADLEYQKQIDEIEKAIQDLQDEMDNLTDNIDKQIDALNEYKDKWGEIVGEYEKSQNRMIAASILGQNVEADILAMRTDILNAFAENYIAKQQAMADAAIKAAEAERDALQIANGVGGGTSTSGGSGNVTQIVIPYGDGTDPRLDKAKPTREKEKEDEEERKRRNGANVRNRAYYIMNKGGVVGSSGGSSPMAKKVGEDMTIFVKHGERVLTPVQNKYFENLVDALPKLEEIRQMSFKKQMPEYMTNPGKWLTQNTVTNNSPTVVNQTIHVTMPNITNSSSAMDLVKDLESLSVKMLQAF